MPLFHPKMDLTNTSARWNGWRDLILILSLQIYRTTPGSKPCYCIKLERKFYEIFKIVPDTGADDDYKTTVYKLTGYFKPEKKVYQSYVFRQANQGPKEPIEDFYTRLRGLAKSMNGNSSQLRKCAPRDPNYTLQDMSMGGRKLKLVLYKPQR